MFILNYKTSRVFRGFEKLYCGIGWRVVATRKSIKGAKDWYYSLDSNKILSHEIGSLDWRWRHQKSQDLPQSWRYRPKTPNPKL